jgi:F-type H+-transporting ATPase subunit epsilon
MKFSLKVISPVGRLFEGEVDFLTAPAIEGELGVLARHTPLLTALKAGDIKIKKDNSVQKFSIESGFLEISEAGVYILVNTPREDMLSGPPLN